jgi:hypothetical protein
MMGRFVVKADRDRDLYLIWSTVVDAPIWVGDRAELVKELWAEYRREHPHSTPNAGHGPDARIRRADETGTSALDCDWYGWDDETFMVMAGAPDDGWYHLRRDRLADYAEALLRDDEAGARALLE